jgi:hypothetical protein
MGEGEGCQFVINSRVDLELSSAMGASDGLTQTLNRINWRKVVRALIAPTLCLWVRDMCIGFRSIGVPDRQHTLRSSDSRSAQG